MRLIRTGVGVSAATLLLAGCGGGDDGGGGSGEVVDGGTFTMALSSDPGNLDPQASAASDLFQLSHFAYDSLVFIDSEGEVVSGIAEDWTVDAETVTLTIGDDVTCSDGSPFTASDAAANLNWIADPANQSPFLGVFVPVGVQATADDATNTVTMDLAGPAPFVLEGLAGVPMVCAGGLEDRDQLASETLGTGPYELTEAVPSDHYTYTLREGYTWGPGGASTDAEGMPDEIVAQVVGNETTSANLLLSGGLNAAQVLGPDAERLAEEGLFDATVTAVLGEMWFHQAEGRPTADPAVRMALTQAVDLDQLAEVLTSGRGGPGTTFAASAPASCPGDSVSGALPEHDLAAAQQLLDEAGWQVGADGVRSKDGQRLELTFLYDSALGAPGSAAAELVVAAWTELGAEVTTTPKDETAAVETIFGTGDWEVAWIPVNVSSPDQMVPFLSGPTVPDGNNFAAIDNPDYTQLVGEAMTMIGTEGCDTWLEAEAALVRDADVVPFANQDVSFFGSGAEFEVVDVLQPTSIRMVD
ncbi:MULTISPECIES: ABC transporter substrate-binding protein [unclassified Modestobacter]|uniref:ABC transporter substrate-binding protein n=1 Tax=unclassified Modestobacter TaxID=2643866 RepID=UPI0022AA8F74|nr:MULTISPECIES: ABC transporter substrate-binding protein [unclassified Modestobacter]MCZ2826780.1 ABC transporter substrate-binding protein [Modestobacter sp. VKM Ac-2981]MCZ2855160.1 ABC transporter substrate-binding protein [Modestobacter sp. VKM Ac-2982]